MADGDVSPICEHIILLQEVLYHFQITVYRDTRKECGDIKRHHDVIFLQLDGRQFSLTQHYSSGCVGCASQVGIRWCLMVTQGLSRHLLRDTRLRNVSDLNFDLSRSNPMVQLDSPYYFLLVSNSNHGNYMSKSRRQELQPLKMFSPISYHQGQISRY